MPDGLISTNIVAVKTKIAPSIAISIPRLENGCGRRCSIGKRIATVIDFPIGKATIWSNSVNVYGGSGVAVDNLSRLLPAE